MSAQIAKELRQVLPVWVATAVMSLPLIYLMPATIGTIPGLLLLVLGCTILSVSSFGTEFGNRTMGLLLVQPKGRNHIWCIKMLVITLALLPFTAALLWAFLTRNEPSDYVLDLGVWLMAILIIWATGPFWGLYTRRTLSGVIFAITTPLLLIMLINMVLPQIHRWNLAAPATTVATVIIGALLLYCGSLLVLGLVKFKKLELVESNESLEFTGIGADRIIWTMLRRVFGEKPHATAGMIRKELNLHSNIVLAAVVFCVIELLALTLIKLAHSNEEDLYFTLPLFIYTVLVPIMVGAVTVAEERSLGIHSANLVLPVRHRRQWTIKAAVALTVSFVFGILVPAFWITASQFVSKSLGWPESVTIGSAVSWILLQASVTSLAIYASSISRNTLGAAVIALGAFGVVAVLATILRGLLNENELSSLGVSYFKGLGFVMIIQLLFHGFRNYRTIAPERKNIAIQLLALAAAPPVVLVLMIVAASVMGIWKG